MMDTKRTIQRAAILLMVITSIIGLLFTLALFVGGAGTMETSAAILLMIVCLLALFVGINAMRVLGHDPAVPAAAPKTDPELAALRRSHAALETQLAEHQAELARLKGAPPGGQA